MEDVKFEVEETKTSDEATIDNEIIVFATGIY